MELVGNKVVSFVSFVNVLKKYFSHLCAFMKNSRINIRIVDLTDFKAFLMYSSSVISKLRIA